MSEIPEIPAPSIPPEGVKDQPLGFIPDAATKAAIDRVTADLRKAMTPADEGAAVERAVNLIHTWLLAGMPEPDTDTGDRTRLFHAIETVLAALQEAARKVGERNALLKRFAKDAENWADSVHDDYRPKCTEPRQGNWAYNGSETAFTVGDLRAAAALLAEPTE